MHDFRAADVEAGGQGAPFVPVYHRALAQSLRARGPIVVVNIGGVSNITYIDGMDTLIACDTGPGNALLDDFMFRTMNQAFDTEGRFAALGKADEAWIARALDLPFFSAAAAEIARPQRFCRAEARRWRPADGAATLTAFTAAAIARVIPLLPKRPRSWIICGGGARNLTMLRMLRERVGSATVEAAETAGLGLRCDRGPGLRLPRRPRAEGPAAVLSGHHRRADADDRRGDRAALIGPITAG